MNAPVAAACGRRAWLGMSLSALFCVTAHAAPSAQLPLPEPLTLESALALATTEDPDVQQAHADVALAQARQQEAASDNGLQAGLQGRAFRVEPSRVGLDQGRDDSSISLVLRKPLFDFGRNSASVAAEQAETQGSEWRLLDAQQQRHLTIMARYFEVLLADLAAARDEAALTLADHRRRSAVARQQLGQISRIDLGAEQTKYLDAKRQHLASAALSQATRRALAISLNHAGQLPVTLSEPQLIALDRAPPGLNALSEAAQTHNPQLLAERAQVEAARQRVQSARAQRLPVLNGELAASNYSRQTDERDDWHAGVTLDVPLYTSGKTQAVIAARHAQLQHVEAEYARAQQLLAESLQGTLDEIAALQVQREQARAQLDFRTLALQRSRGLHASKQDAEIFADSAQLATARLFQAQTDYQLALTWARLDALLGKLPDSAAATQTTDTAISIPLKN